MSEELVRDIIFVLSKHGLMRPTSFRNDQIVMEYRKLRRSGIRGKEARTTLSEKYFLSEKQIQTILYAKPSKTE